MEPHLITDPKLTAILKELKDRESIFHHPDKFGTQRSDLENMTEPSFWEVGASGRRYSREYVISVFLERYAKNEEDIWEAKDFHCFEIAKDNYLLTYTLIQNKTRVTRRSTIWRNTNSGWKILYHQGTVVADET